MITKKYYSDNPDKVHSYWIEGKRNPCECGSNVFHYEYDGINIFAKCNSCNKTIYEIKKEYIEECLSEGLWK